jgi:hypothetical protein
VAILAKLAERRVMQDMEALTIDKYQVENGIGMQHALHCHHGLRGFAHQYAWGHHAGTG